VKEKEARRIFHSKGPGFFSRKKKPFAFEEGEVHLLDKGKRKKEAAENLLAARKRLPRCKGPSRHDPHLSEKKQSGKGGTVASIKSRKKNCVLAGASAFTRWGGKKTAEGKPSRLKRGVLNIIQEGAQGRPRRDRGGGTGRGEGGGGVGKSVKLPRLGTGGGFSS